MTTAPATDELRQHLEDYRSSGSVYLPNVVESAIRSCTDDALIGELARRGRWLIEQPDGDRLVRATRRIETLSELLAAVRELRDAETRLWVHDRESKVDAARERLGRAMDADLVEIRRGGS